MNLFPNMVRDVAITQYHGSQWTSGTVNDWTDARHQICAGAGSLAKLLKNVTEHGGRMLKLLQNLLLWEESC